MGLYDERYVKASELRVSCNAASQVSHTGKVTATFCDVVLPRRWQLPVYQSGINGVLFCLVFYRAYDQLLLTVRLRPVSLSSKFHPAAPGKRGKVTKGISRKLCPNENRSDDPTLDLSGQQPPSRCHRFRTDPDIIQRRCHAGRRKGSKYR